jgi:hypothetical protein
MCITYSVTGELTVRQCTANPVGRAIYGVGRIAGSDFAQAWMFISCLMCVVCVAVCALS